jgi:hypothetical protein
LFGQQLNRLNFEKFMLKLNFNYLKIYCLIFLILSIFVLNIYHIINPLAVQAIGTNIEAAIKDTSGGEQNFFKDNLGDYISVFIDAILIIGALAALIFIILGGLQYITSEGDKEKTKSAFDRIRGAIIGLAILAVAYLAWGLIIYVLGLNKLNKLKINLPLLSINSTINKHYLIDYSDNQINHRLLTKAEIKFYSIIS